MEPMEPEMDGMTGDPGDRENAPGETRLEKVMRERFGAPAFGSLMDGIVDKMFKDLEEKGASGTDGEAGEVGSEGDGKTG
jgi:hypothetical protein